MKYTILFILLTATITQAVLVPVDNVVPWTPGATVGVVGGIRNRTTGIVSVITHGADPTGAVSSLAAVNAAIAATPDNGVTYFPAGTYLLNGIIGIKNNTTMRGAGMNQTTIKGNMHIVDFTYPNTDPPYGFWVNNYGYTPLVTAGHTKGSTTLTVSGDTSSFVVGRMLQITRYSSSDQYADPLVLAPGGPGWLFRQMTRLIAKSGSTLTIYPPVYFNMNGAECHVTSGNYNKQFIGMEDLTLDATGQHEKGIQLGEISNSWFKNVKVRGFSGRGFYIQTCMNLEITGCYVDGPSGFSPNGAGIEFDTVCASLVENTILRNIFPCLQVNAGSSGNVFAYNFSLNDNGLFEIDTNHGAHNVCNLYEGNVANSLMSDGYYGSESNTTLFRNWFTGIAAGYAISLKRMARDFAFIGNVIGHKDWNLPGQPGDLYHYDGTAFGQPNIGNDSDNGLNAPPWPEFPNAGNYQEFDTGVEASTIRKGNWTFYLSAQESLGGDTLPNSLYLSAKPAWFGNLTWPPINPAAPGTPTTSQIWQKIPAGYRYVNGVDPPGVGLPDTTPPVLSSKVINAAGTQLALSFSETVSIGLGGSGGWTLNMTGGAVTVTGAPVVSGSTITWNLSRTIGAGQTGTVSYVQPGNGVEDVAGNDLASLSNSAVTNTASADGTAPTPNPSTFGIAPTATNSTTITMTATNSVDAATPPVQYFFNETSGNAGGSDSNWQSSSTFTDTGLAAGTQYRYRVQTRDSAVPPNVTTFSQEFSATTKSVAGAHPAMPFKMARANIVTP